MDESTRRYLAEIGRRGGTQSRRSLSPEEARSMVQAREARRAALQFAESELARHVPALPGTELVLQGLLDLANGQESDAALLVSMAAPRLRLIGIAVPKAWADPETRLHARLQSAHGDAAHGRYNALVRRIVSFQRAAGALVNA